MIVFELLFSVIMPVFALIGIGGLVDRRMALDLPTLTRLNFWVFVPALLFLVVLDAEIDGGEIAWIFAFTLVHATVLFGVASLLALHPRLRPHRVVLRMGAILFNSGNYGIPFVTLAFQGEPAAIGGAAIAVIIMSQNFLSYTVGICMLQPENSEPVEVLKGLFRIPVLYAIGLALCLRTFDIALLDEIRAPLQYLANGLIPIALLTLGVQLSRSAPGQAKLTVGVIALLRLVLSPLAAAGLVLIFGFGQQLALILIAVTGLPMAVNAFILCAHYHKDEDLASQAVFWSTLLSALTLPLILVLIGGYL